MLQAHTWIKDTLKGQGRQMGFNVTEHENVDMTLDSILQLTCKKAPLVNFWCTIKGEYP